jgi:hypothetical protein
VSEPGTKHGEPGHVEHVTACARCAEEWAKRTPTEDLIGAVLDLLDAAEVRAATTPKPKSE